MEVEIIKEDSKNLYQFDHSKIDKEFLLNETSLERLYIQEDFEIDNKMVAVLATDNSTYGKSLVIHAELGVFFIDRTTTELMNEYHRTFSYGFEVSRTIAQMQSLNRHLPLVYGQNIYMPLTGKRGRSPDWVGLHLIDGFKQKDAMASFETILDTRLDLAFSQGNLREKIHNACLISEYHMGLVAIFANQFGTFKPFNKRVGITNKFSHCECAKHQNLPQGIKDIKGYLDHQKYMWAYQASFDDLDQDREAGTKMKIRRINEMKRW
jgi:hypothetical protein